MQSQNTYKGRKQLCQIKELFPVQIPNNALETINNALCTQNCLVSKICFDFWFSLAGQNLDPEPRVEERAAGDEPEPQVLPPAPGGLAVARAAAHDRGRRGGARPRPGQHPREELHQGAGGGGEGEW